MGTDPDFDCSCRFAYDKKFKSSAHIFIAFILFYFYLFFHTFSITDALKSLNSAIKQKCKKKFFLPAA